MGEILSISISTQYNIYFPYRKKFENNIIWKCNKKNRNLFFTPSLCQMKFVNNRDFKLK